MRPPRLTYIAGLCRRPRRRTCLFCVLFSQVPTLLLWIYQRHLLYLTVPEGLACVGISSTDECPGSDDIRALETQRRPPHFDFNITSAGKVKRHCSGRLQIHDRLFAVFRDVILDPSRATAKARGGADVDDILSQREGDEYYRLGKGFLTVINCSDPPLGRSLDLQGDQSHVVAFRNSVRFLSPGKQAPLGYQSASYFPAAEADAFVITLTRNEFANVYWMVMELYDLFLVLSYMNRTFADAHLMILDAHPRSSLDDLLHGVFKDKVLRPSDIKGVARINTLCTGLPRHLSPMLRRELPSLPIIDAFRTHVLGAFDLKPISDDIRRQRCLNNSLSALFIWRRDYVAHPRNPDGKVARKISNEEELLAETALHFPRYSIKGVQLDNYAVAEQMTLLADTDVFIGMHGAAFGFVPFLAPGSGVVEMWPRHWPSNWHMEFLSNRSGLLYRSWKNTYEENEDRDALMTKVVPAEILKILSELSESICDAYRRR